MRVGGARVVLAGVVAVSALATSPPAGASGLTWSSVTTPNPGASQHNLLSGVACITTSDCWAVGNSFSSSGAFQTLAEHCNGSAWSIVTPPNPSSQGDGLQGVACITTSDCWAVGAAFTGSGSVAEHWDGSAWSVVPTPNSTPQANVLSRVACVDASDCWAVGTSTVPSGNTSRQQTLAEHWNGATWSIVATPNATSQADNLSAVACITTSDCWTV